MKLRNALVGLAALAWAAPAVPQAPNPYPQSISGTLAKAMCRLNGICTIADINGHIAHIQEKLGMGTDPVWKATCGAGKTWLCLAGYFQFPTGANVGQSGTGFGGGGATGAWDPCDFPYRFDAANNLLVPAVPMGSSSSVQRGQTGTGTASAQSSTNEYDGGFGTYRIAESQSAAGKWIVHAHNVQYRNLGDKRAWTGVGYYDPAPSRGYRACSQAYYNSAGTYVGTSCIWVPASTGNYGAVSSSPTAYPNCPEGGAGGVGIEHFVIFNGANSTGRCIAYVKNESLGPGGFAISGVFPVAYADATGGNFETSFPHLAACPIAKEFTRRMAQALWNKAAQQPGYSGPAPGTITDQDVPDEPKPTVDDIADEPTTLPPVTEVPPDPTPTPSPTPTPTPTGTETVGEMPSATDPIAPDIDWWPDLPTISLSLGNPNCPTYDFSVPQFGWEATMDSHCPLIEANRAVIAALCMLIWTIGSIVIVLRA